MTQDKINEQPTPSQSELVGWWREGNDLDESDYYPAEHFPDLDTTGCIPLYTKPQPTSQDAVDAERYRCLCSMATKDYERSVGYQFAGKLNDFVDDIKPYVDEALAEMKEGK